MKRRFFVQSKAIYAALAVGTLCLSAFVLIRAFPLQYLDLSDRTKLRLAGVKSIGSPAGDSGVEWVSPKCERASAESIACTCVVFVHGLGDSVLTWKKILAQREWVSRTQKPLRLVAWDLPGHGQSPEPPRNPDGDLQLRAQSLAQRVLGATQSRGCGPNTIWVGNSFGGWISSWIALKRPDQVKSLILVAPAGMKDQRVSSLGSSLLATPTVDSLRAFRQQAYAKPQKDYPEWIWKAAVERVKKSPVARVRSAQQSEDDLDLPIKTLRARTYVLWGKQDRILPLEKSQGFRQIPRDSLAQWQEFEGCGHLFHKECTDPLIETVLETVNR
ncbi:MAG: alpha/beta hydrolase [Bdellovibrionales bacterium]|nr:alpha/beta hydrolase [Bdellovibrionales bacterium]